MTEPITFILNGEKQTVSGLSPTMTVLEYLRTQVQLTGTKEGCAEGDCGACTVIIGEPSSKATEIAYKAVNACILFLPVLDGREVITIEHLKAPDGTLHPVQQAMVDCHGSQCGFCTPGFVMALSCLSHNHPAPNDEEIQDAIAGNLCRCTGYRPILDAARQATQNGSYRLETHPEALKALQRKILLRYEAEGSLYLAPVTLEELAETLAQYPEATLLAGGTDVGLWVTKQHRHLPVIIYTGNVTALREIIMTDQATEIGAAVTYTEAFDALAQNDTSLGELLRRLGSVHIRNSGTIGGNIANGSPIGDSMPPLIALGAKIVLRHVSGTRTLPLEDYFIAYGKQDRQPGEFIEKIIVPYRAENVQFKTYKISKRFDQDISAVCAGFALHFDGEVITEARLAYGGMAATPKRARQAEAALIGEKWKETTLKKAITAVAEEFTPLTDLRASAQYRLRVAQNLLARFYLETTNLETATQVYRYAKSSS